MIEYCPPEVVLRKLRQAKLAKAANAGERSNVPSGSRPPRQRPSETRRTQVEPSVVMKKLSSLPAGFNDVAAPAMPVYDNRSIMQENEAAFQPVAMETVPPRPLSKPRFAPKSAVPAPAEKEHLSELQKKLTLRKIASETGNLPPGATPQLPPPPPTTSPPSLALSHSDDAPMPPKKPPRETHATPPSPEPRAYSPEGDSMFLEALKLKKGSLKRAQTLQVISPPPQVSDEPIRPVNPPRPISGTQEHNDTQNTPTFKHSSSTLGRLKRYETDIAIGTNTPVPPDSPPHQGQRARVGTLLSKVSTTDSWPLDRFLSALKLSDYLSVLSEAGYAESADLVGISADDVTEAGVSKAGHKKKFLASIQSLSAKHAGYDHIPTSIETWLSQWNLSSYQDTLIDSGYDDLEFIADMTSEDLRELGIEKRPILNRFSLALSHLHTCIVTHRSIVLSSSPHVTPKKPSVPAQQPEKAMARSNLKPTQPTNSVTPRKPSADSTSRMSQHEDTLTPTKWTPPTPPEPTSQLLRKTSEPSVAKKPGIPPPVSRKPGLEKRNSKPLTSPDQLPDFPSPPRLPNERKEFPSPPRLSDVKKEFPSPSKLPDVKKEFPSPPRLPDVKKEFPSPPRLPDVKKEFPSPPSAQSISDDFPPPPPSVQSSVIFSDFHEDLPPPPLEMSFPLDEIPPPPPPDTYREFLSRDDRQNRMSGIADLDDVLSSMSSEGVSSPLRPYPPKVTQDRPIQSSDVLSDIDQMLANLNLEIDSFMTDS